MCGHEQDRYEPLPPPGSDSNKNELVVSALKSVAVSARKLGNRSHGRDNLAVTSEYDVQDLAELALRSIFPDVEREEWTPKSAGPALSKMGHSRTISFDRGAKWIWSRPTIAPRCRLA